MPGGIYNLGGGGGVTLNISTESTPPVVTLSSDASISVNFGTQTFGGGGSSIVDVHEYLGSNPLPVEITNEPILFTPSGDGTMAAVIFAGEVLPVEIQNFNSVVSLSNQQTSVLVTNFPLYSSTVNINNQQTSVSVVNFPTQNTVVNVNNQQTTVGLLIDYGTGVVAALTPRLSLATTTKSTVYTKVATVYDNTNATVTTVTAETDLYRKEIDLTALGLTHDEFYLRTKVVTGSTAVGSGRTFTLKGFYCSDSGVQIAAFEFSPKFLNTVNTLKNSANNTQYYGYFGPFKPLDRYLNFFLSHTVLDASSSFTVYADLMLGQNVNLY